MAQRSFRTAGYLAIIAGLILIVSGVTSGSILLTALGAADNYLGSKIGSADIVLQFAIVALTYLVGLGGLLAIAGGVLLLLKHGSGGGSS